MKNGSNSQIWLENKLELESSFNYLNMNQRDDPNYSTGAIPKMGNSSAVKDDCPREHISIDFPAGIIEQLATGTRSEPYPVAATNNYERGECSNSLNMSSIAALQGASGITAAIITGGAGESLESLLGKKLLHQSSFTSKCCIFKVPSTLQRHNEEAFAPNVVAIGPFHRREKKLTAMNGVKWKYLNALLERKPTLDTSLKNFIEKMKEIEEQAREAYAAAIDMSSDEFVEMLIVDGCFVIELLRREAGAVQVDENDPIFKMSFMLENLSRDLVLLENQLPWLVLDRLNTLTFVPEPINRSLVELALNFFRRISPLTVGVNLRILPAETKHLLNLLRNSLLSPLTKRDPKYTKDWSLIPSVTNLVEAGLEFKSGTPDNILNAKFKNGMFEIPPVIIHENTEALFRNLIAFEQCDHQCGNEIASYAVLFDRLINSFKDVEVMSKAGILQNWMTPQDASLLFNRLHNDASFGDFLYFDLCEQVAAYCQLRRHRWRATLMREYFNTPWAAISFGAGVTLLILTFLQTFFTIKQNK